MAKCAACGKFISAKGGANCSNFTCPNRYHTACLLLPESATISSDWQCPECRKKVPKGDNSATPVKDVSGGPPIKAGPVAESAHGALSRSPVAEAKVEARVGSERCAEGEPSPESQLTLREEIRIFRTELREVRDEIREFRREMVVLHSSLGACSERVDSLEARIEALESKPIVAPDKNKVSQLELTVSRLQNELNDRDQEMLSSDLEISNIPELPGENVMHTVATVAAKLGVTLEERDIVFAQRVGLRAAREVEVSTAEACPAGASPVGGAARGRRIVVRLSRRALRDNLLQSARVRRGATTADLGFPAAPRRFYLNERLTRMNKFLFYRVREAANRCGWRYAWTKFGRILVKQGDGKPTHCIRTEEDILRIFDHVPSTVKET